MSLSNALHFGKNFWFLFSKSKLAIFFLATLLLPLLAPRAEAQGVLHWYCSEGNLANRKFDTAEACRDFSLQLVQKAGCKVTDVHCDSIPGIKSHGYIFKYLCQGISANCSSIRFEKTRMFCPQGTKLVEAESALAGIGRTTLQLISFGYFAGSKALSADSNFCRSDNPGR